MRLLVPFALLVLALLVVIQLDDAPVEPDFVFVNQNEIFTLDPQRMSYLQDLRLAHALYEGLLRWNNFDFTIHPAVAVDLPAISEDRLTYTFHLRPDARWSNGDQVTAHDYVYSWRRAMLPDTAADYSGLFFMIDGAEEHFAFRQAQTEAFAADDSISADERPVIAEELWREAERHFDETVGLRALDDSTLEVRLARPTAYFLDLLCFGIYFPVHRPTVEGWPAPESDAPLNWAHVEPPPFAERQWVSLNPRTGRFRQEHGWAKPDRFVGNGPYGLDEWRYKRDMRLTPNPFYHDPDRVRSKVVTAVTIEDTNTAMLAYESGRIDWLLDLTADYQADLLRERLAYDRRHADELARLREEGLTEAQALAQLPPPLPGERRDVHPIPAFGTYFMNFNCRPKLADGRANPFANPAVRRAFALATNKQTIVEQVTRLSEPVMATLIPPGSIVGYDAPEGLPFDPARAQAELSSAGWADRDGDGLIENADGRLFPVIDFLYTTNTDRDKWIALNLKDQWESALGVRVELRAAETKFYKDDLKTGNFMIARGRWYGDYGDPTTFLELCRSTDGNNDRKFADPYVDGLLERADMETDPEERMALLEECERYLFQEALPMIPIHQLVQIDLYDPMRVRGISHHPRLSQFLWQVRRIDEP